MLGGSLGCQLGSLVFVGLALGSLDGWVEPEGWPERCGVGLEDRLGAIDGIKEGDADTEGLAEG